MHARGVNEHNLGMGQIIIPDLVAGCLRLVGRWPLSAPEPVQALTCPR